MANREIRSLDQLMDGGVWKNDAVERIQEYIDYALHENELHYNIYVIA